MKSKTSRMFMLVLLLNVLILGGKLVLESSEKLVTLQAKEALSTRSGKNSTSFATLESSSPIIQYGEHTKRKRLHRLEFYCRSLKNSTGLIWTSQFLNPESKPRLYYSNAHKLLLCETPKCGSTQWRNLFLIADHLVQGNSVDEIDDRLGAKAFAIASKRYLWNLRIIEKDILSEYFRIMTVREPLERLVSAYKDKLENPKSSFYSEISKFIHTKFGAKKYDSKEFASFREFVEMLLSEDRIIDPHWSPYSDLCYPCQVKYDFILKMETIREDIDYLSKILAINRSQFFSDDNRWDLESRRSRYYEYVSQLPKNKLEGLFKLYKSQYDMFGYPYPSLVSLK